MAQPHPSRARKQAVMSRPPVSCLLTSCLWLLASGSQAAAPAPQFEDYPAGPLLRDKPAPPRLSEGYTFFPFRDRHCLGTDIESARGILADDKVNFGAQWILHECSCGPDCVQLLIWDARSGHITREQPFRSLYTSLPGSKGGALLYCGLSYRPDSLLLIAEGCVDRQKASACARISYLWTGNKFIRLHRGKPRP